ncbi:MAG: HAMP domain-containing protein [Acidobacteria bacterium]|nr:HAMP domain-containing protein [Acidobacteriota bacterium]
MPEIEKIAGVASKPEGSGEGKVSSMRVNWQLKTIWPVAVVLLAGMLLFLLSTVSLRDPDRHRVLVIAGAGAVAICGVIIVALASTIQRPMIELQEQMERVGEGDLTASVSFAKHNDEIGDLGRNFNRMVRQLRESREEIEHLHRTQMSRAEHFATLGELATGLAHEIRNPLAGIAGVIEIVGRDLPATSPAKTVVKEVRQEVSQINRILTDLLETARPRTPEMRLSDLNTTVEHAVMLARQQVISKPIKIEFTAGQNLPDVEHDSDQIHQVLLNLLLNAVQAIESSGLVRVAVFEQGDAAVVTVSDTGRGIPAEHLPNIFRPFYTTKGNGTGLGLSLARRIVEEHHGQIEVASSSGKGATFSVVLPVRQPVAAAS